MRTSTCAAQPCFTLCFELLLPTVERLMRYNPNTTLQLGQSLPPARKISPCKPTEIGRTLTEWKTTPLDTWFKREVVIHEAALTRYLRRCAIPISARPFIFAIAKNLMADRCRDYAAASTGHPFGELWQVPNNAGLVDYTSLDEPLAIFQNNVTHWVRSPERHCFFSTGFHQETARKFLGRLDEAIGAIKRMAEEAQLPVVFTARPLDFLV